MEFLEAGITFEAFLSIWNGVEKSIAADHDEFFPGPGYDHIKSGWDCLRRWMSHDPGPMW